MLKALRETGICLSEAAGTPAVLLGPGMAGTEAELRLLAGRLRQAGAAPAVRRDP